VPEGNTVLMNARRLHQALAGQPLTIADLRTPTLSTTDLTGRTVLEVVARGKHLLTRIEGDRTLHTHLRMDGRWRTYPAGHSTADSQDHIRVVLGNERSTCIGYRLHDVALVETNREDDLVGHLGPDLLGPDWDAGEALRRIEAYPQRSIAEALLDQRNLAGAGNVYKTEICFLRGISPWTPVADVPNLAAVVDLSYRLLQANRNRYDHVTTGDDRPGRRVYIFERHGRPCLRCGTTIRAAWQGEPPRERISYWCPTCQPGPGPTTTRPVPAPAAVRLSRTPNSNSNPKPSRRTTSR
jgi:formamidopyrimidine-DNA glycosylase